MEGKSLATASHADKIRAGLSKWRAAPPGLPAAAADEFMNKLKAGNTIRMLTALSTDPGFICSYARFKTHCDLNAIWGEEAWRVSRANMNRLKSVNNRLRKSATCRAGLHPMTGDNLRYRSRGTRVCVACERVAGKRVPTPLTEALKEKIRAMFASGRPVTVSLITHGKTPGGGGKRVKPIAIPKDFYHARATDPLFDRFIIEATVGSGSLGQRLRHAKARARVERAKSEQDARDYFAVLAMIPHWFPEQDKYDVVNEVTLELDTGKITRDQLRDRVSFHMKEANKMFAPKFSKFGNSQLLSLDALAFEDGTTTIGDSVSRGLWD